MIPPPPTKIPLSRSRFSPTITTATASRTSSAAATASGAEGNSGPTPLVFAVTLSNPSSSIVSANYLAADGEFFEPGTAKLAINNEKGMATLATMRPDGHWPVAVHPLAVAGSPSEVLVELARDEEDVRIGQQLDGDAGALALPAAVEAQEIDQESRQKGLSHPCPGRRYDEY